MKQIILSALLMLTMTSTRNPQPATRILQEVHFVYFIGNQHFEDWQWFSTNTPAKEIEFAFRRWVRVIENTAVKQWNFTGATEVEYLQQS